MATGWFACGLILLSAHLVSSSGPDEVPFTQVSNAEERRAVCIDGTPAGYYYGPGSGDGAKNWIVYLQGGGWCPNDSACRNKRSSYIGTGSITSTNLTGILSKRQDINPDFHNWNRIFVHYCDQSSFLGDTEIVDQGTNLQFRGSKIFDAVIEDLLARGMNNADNAILAGISAGGVATILRCDGFRALVPNAGRVKCISDAGFFIRAKDLPNADYREQFFASTIMFHNISSLLPTSCTTRTNPSLCLFPENLIGDIQTPLFLLNNAFDVFQLENLLVPPDSSDWTRWNTCVGDLQNCTPTQKQLIKDFRIAFLKELMEIPDNPLSSLFIDTCLAHTVTDDKLWNIIKLKDMALVQALGNWYFDRGSTKLIDTNVDFPQACS